MTAFATHSRVQVLCGSSSWVGSPAASTLLHMAWIVHAVMLIWASTRRNFSPLSQVTLLPMLRSRLMLLYFACIRQFRGGHGL